MTQSCSPAAEVIRLPSGITGEKLALHARYSKQAGGVYGEKRR